MIETHGPLTEVDQLREDNRDLKVLVYNLTVSAVTMSVFLKMMSKDSVDTTKMATLLTLIETATREAFAKNPKLLQQSIQELGIPTEDLDPTDQN